MIAIPMPRLFCLILMLLVICPCPAWGQKRNPAWAVPVYAEGLPNLHRVTAHLYRSAQPTAEGLRNAADMGLRTVLNLRAFHSDDELAEGAGLTLMRLEINTWAMDEEEILTGLRIISRAEPPVLVHCQHGADRTGTLLAAYRMVIQGWPREEAIAEMLDGGYGYHAIWGNLITLLENLDVAGLRAQLLEDMEPQPLPSDPS